MATVLLGWGLGGGMGHARKLIPVARDLHARGHRPVLALHDIQGTRPLWHDLPFPVVPAPKPVRRTKRPPAHSFADILYACGFETVELLESRVRAWDGLLEVTGAEVCVTDSAPALDLACHGRVPCVTTGTGYAVPPAAGHAFPPLSSRTPPQIDLGRLMQIVADVQRRRGRSVPDSVPAILGAPRVVACAPELDPYVADRPPDEVGSSFDPPLPITDVTAAACGRRVFAYLAGGFAHLRSVVEALGNFDARTELYVGQADNAFLSKVEAGFPRLTVHREPQPFGEALARNAIVLHHGGVGTSEAALSIGRPQVILVRHGEGQLNARQLDSLEVSLSTRRDAPAREAIACLDTMLRQIDRFGSRAQAAAQRVHARGDTPARTRIVAAVEDALAGRGV